MSSLFSQILNMSLTAGIIILCVLAARLLLKKAPKIYSYALWAVVLFRLLCPVSLTASVSVLEVTKPEVAVSAGVTSTVTYLPAEYVFTESPQEQPAVQYIETKQETVQPQSRAIQPMTIVSCIWLAGIAVMVLYSAMVYIRLYRSLIGAMPYRGNVYLADHIASPFVLGVLFPKIYLPSSIPMQERRYIVAHERHHIRRGDHIIKLLAYAALCIHWFNPLVWAAFILAGKDMEMSCDEAVIKKLGEHIRADYSASLLRLATHRTIIAGTPLAFGEGDTKGRVMNMAKWKKPKVWVSILCVILCAVILVACAVNPEAEAEPEETTNPVEIVMINGPTTAGFGDLYYTLPAGYTVEAVEADAGDYDYMLQISDGTNIIGGVVYYDAPDFKFHGVEALDLWEASDETLGYMGGGSLYGDYEIEYFTDLPEPVENPVQRQHYFFAWEDAVYDFWFDETVAGYKTIETIMKTAAVGQGGPLVVEVAPAETEALEKCRAVLEMVQSGSCQIAIEQLNGSTKTRWSVSNFYQHDGDWLKIIDIDPETEDIADGEEWSARLAYMYADGVRYSNEGRGGNAYSDINWAEYEYFDDSLKSWLASFQWNDQIVTYVDTLTDNEDTVAMLRIDEPYPGLEEETECYWVDFFFDAGGSFIKAKLEVDYIHNDEVQSIDNTESIVTLDPDTVAAEIDKEYQRAIS